MKVTGEKNVLENLGPFGRLCCTPGKFEHLIPYENMNGKCDKKFEN